MLFSLDRFENDVAIFVDENACCREVSSDALPSDVQVGDMLREIDGVFKKDEQATAARRAQVLLLQNKLRRK